MPFSSVFLASIAFSRASFSDMTGESLIGIEYCIVTQKGHIYEGKTDHEGKTVRVYTDEPEAIECFIA